MQSSQFVLRDRKVRTVNMGSTAERCGLAEGDLLLSINDQVGDDIFVLVFCLAHLLCCRMCDLWTVLRWHRC